METILGQPWSTLWIAATCRRRRVECMFKLCPDAGSSAYSPIMRRTRNQSGIKPPQSKDFAGSKFAVCE
jgi:hypothetical protein